MDKTQELASLREEAASIDINDAQPLGDQLARDVSLLMGRPERQDWEQDYTPEEADRYRAELAELEAELDQGWPGWRERRPWTDASPSKAAWIKIRLKRRDLIQGGKGLWGVHIVWKGRLVTSDGRTVVREGKPFAIPVRPVGRLTGPYRPIYSVSMIAAAEGLDPSDVEEALSVMPPGTRAARSWVRRSQSAGAGSDAPPAAQTGPPSSVGGE